MDICIFFLHIEIIMLIFFFSYKMQQQVKFFMHIKFALQSAGIMAADESSRILLQILLFLLLLSLLNLIKGDEQLDMIYLEKRNVENIKDEV